MKRAFTRLSPLVVVSFATFVVLGFPDGLLGVMWPSMSTAFSVPLSSLSVLVAASTVSYIVGTLTLGYTLRWFGYASVITAGAAAIAFAALGYVVAHRWWLLVGASGVLGLGAGWLDGGINAYGARHFRVRDLNWLHGFFGVGATLGPVAATAIFSVGGGWRAGYVALVCLALTGVGLVWLVRTSLRAVDAQPDADQGGPADLRSANPAGTTFAQRLLLPSFFFAYAWIEVAAGHWGFTLLTIGLRVPETTASSVVAVYWGAFALGRFVFGWISESLGPGRILRVFPIVVVVGLVFLAVGGPTWIAMLALPAIGIALSPLFATGIAITPQIVGADRTGSAVGVQVATANMGAIAGVAIAGYSIDSVGAGAVPFTLLPPAVAVGLIAAVLLRRLRRPT